ncbi:MAG TPA: acyl-CoA dehydrogenase family protein [Frankiaceae bacterium]|nr:acyl-CoA dehydrogenase family protein [Frankiaceae bacterium]
MDFDDTPEEVVYRARVRAFLDEHRDELVVTGDPTHRRARPTRASVAAYQRTQAVLHGAGLVGVAWPRECGGQGGTPVQQAIVDQELARAGVPLLVNFVGVGMCGPTIVAHGTDEQKARWLGPLLRADEVWCQLFSEPGAGSDLAALATRARRVGDGSWRVTGQKVWTSGAHYSVLGILLARTDPTRPKHRGLTMFVVDMHAPGVTVRPLRQMSGAADFNEVFFDDVDVLDSSRLGAVDDGWRVAITTLMSERLAIGGGGGDLGPPVEELVRLAARRLPGLPPERAALARQELGRAYVESVAARYTGYRRLTALSRGVPPGPEAAAGKLAGTAAARRVADLGVRLLGDDAVWAADPAGEGAWQTAMAALPGLAIAGGTDEILKDVVGERVLGLPPEPRVDAGAPYRRGAGVGP